MNSLYLFNLRTRSERPVITAASLPGGKGFIGKISLSFDARKVLFDFRPEPGAGRCQMASHQRSTATVLVHGPLLGPLSTGTSSARNSIDGPFMGHSTLRTV
jgi:hypothetical protein